MNLHATHVPEPENIIELGIKHTASPNSCGRRSRWVLLLTAPFLFLWVVNAVPVLFFCWSASSALVDSLSCRGGFGHSDDLCAAAARSE